MPRARSQRPHRDPDEDLDTEGPSDADLDRFGDATVTCRNCGRVLYDDTDTCPACLEPLSRRSPSSRPPLWLFLVIGLLVLALLLPTILPFL